MSIESLHELGNNSFVDYSELSNSLKQKYEQNLKGEYPRGVDNGYKKSRQSLFNNFYVFSGDSSNVFLDEDLQEQNRFKNPSVQNLVANKQGANRYDYSDFVFAKKFGELANNRLITLRRFKYPVYDDIFTGQHEPDIARMITWFDQDDNKLSDLFSMSFGLNWKPLTAEMEQMSMNGEQIGYDGVIGKILSNYTSLDTNLDSKWKNNYDPKHDHNKVYGPVDSIASTHIRDIGLNFSQKIDLTFKYQLRSLDGVNPKTAFMDLLSHILQCTMNDGKFWGGSRYWVGRPPSEYANRIRHWTAENFNEFTQRSNVNVKSLLGSVVSGLQQVNAQQVIDMATQVLKNMAISKILDIAGRASTPMMNSLLTNDPVGEWHLTVGNPFRPIFVAGNLILKNTTITVDTEMLGFDDFPTGLVVTCELEHAMPRDRAMIEQMFNVGNGRQYWKPTPEDFKKITRSGDFVNESMVGHTAANIAVVSRELYAFAKTNMYGYDDKMQPKVPTDAKQNQAPSNVNIQQKSK